MLDELSQGDHPAYQVALTYPPVGSCGCWASGAACGCQTFAGQPALWLSQWPGTMQRLPVGVCGWVTFPVARP